MSYEVGIAEGSLLLCLLLCRASIHGGVLAFGRLPSVTLASSTFLNNSAAAGGVAFIQGSAQRPACLLPKEAVLVGCFLLGNTADRCAHAALVADICVTCDGSIGLSAAFRRSAAVYISSPQLDMLAVR